MNRVWRIMSLFFMICSINKLNAGQTASGQEALDAIIQKEFGFSGDQLVNLVARRYYFIHRLAAAHKALHDLHVYHWAKLNPAVQELVIQLPENMVLHNPAVHLAVLRMRDEKSLRALFTLWDELVHYKLLHDDEFLKEFIHVFYIISHNALVLIVPRYKELPEIMDQLNPEQEAEFIDLWCESIRQGKVVKGQALVGLFHKKNIAPVTVNEVMVRFYQLKRIADAIIVVQECQNQGKCSITYHDKDTQIILLHQITFCDPLVIDCVKAMVHTQTYAPFIKLCNDITAYKHLHNAQFIREALMLFFIVYAQLAQNDAHFAKKRALSAETMAIVHDMYIQLPNLSVEEVLDAIDILTEEVAPLLVHYELNSGLTWKVWIRKYWWLPPTFIAVVGVKLYLKSLEAQLLNSGSRPNNARPAYPHNSYPNYL